jgi:hypothetical protein
MQWRAIIKTAGIILSGLATALTLVQAGLGANPLFGWDWAWWALTGLIIFAGLVWWRLYDLESRIREKPAIGECKTIVENDSHFLEVKNTGGFGNFSAQIEVLEDSNNRLAGSTLIGYWLLGKGHCHSEIKNGHKDRIELVHLSRENGMLQGIDLIQCENPQNNRKLIPLIWPRSKSPNYTNGRGRVNIIALPQVYKFRIVISSKPDLREGCFIRNLVFNSDTGLTMD